MDLGYRATKRGYTNLWEPNSLVEHYQEKGVIETYFSKSRVARVAQRNQLFFIWKNITDGDYTRQHLMALSKILTTRIKYWQIFLSTLLFLPLVMKKRQVEKKETILSDK